MGNYLLYKVGYYMRFKKIVHSWDALKIGFNLEKEADGYPWPRVK